MLKATDTIMLGFRHPHQIRTGAGDSGRESGQAIYVHAKVMVIDDRLLRVGKLFSTSTSSSRSIGFTRRASNPASADAARSRG